MNYSDVWPTDRPQGSTSTQLTLGEEVIPCNRKPGPRDRDGHGWVTTMFGIVWHWRCHYCRKHSRSIERPDVLVP